MEKDINKISIIHGNCLVDGKHRNGEIDYINCSFEDDFVHIYTIVEYLKDHYKDNKELQSYDLYTAINKVALTLRNIGAIVFLNTTTYRKDMLEKHGRTGIVILPEEITKEQIETLTNFKNTLEKYREIHVWYDIDKNNHASLKFGDYNVLDEFIKQKTR